MRIALLFLLLSSQSVIAEKLPVEVYTTADGLGSSAIVYMMRDSRGFLWFCTRDGLSRFDGVRFTTYRIGQNPSYPTINHILETRSGIYLIATSGGGIYRFDPNARSPAASSPQDDRADRVILNTEKVSDVSVGVLYEDRSSQLWAGGGGLFRVEEAAGGLAFRQIDLNLPEKPGRPLAVYGFRESRDGSLWLLTYGSATRRLPDGRTIQYLLPSGPFMDNVTALEEDREGRIWMGHNWGFYILNPEPLSSLSNLGTYTERLLPRVESDVRTLNSETLARLSHGELLHFKNKTALGKNPVTAFLQGSDGRMWIADNRGLTVFDGARLQNFNDAQGITENSGGVLAEDVAGNIWVGNQSGGARKLSTSGMTTFDISDGLGELRIHSMYEDRQGNLFVVNGNYFVSRFNGVGFETIRPNIPADARLTWTSNVGLNDRYGDWWMATHSGLYRFSDIGEFEDLSRRRPVFYTETTGLKSSHTYRVFEDGNSDIWIGNRSGNNSLSGLTKWDRSSGSFHVFSEAEGLTSGLAPSAFVQDKEGNLWIGFYEGGLARYAAGRFEFFTNEDGLPRGLITSLYRDSLNRIWVTSSMGGISRIDDTGSPHPSFQTITTANGLSSDNVRCVVEGPAGNIYVGTVRGVDRINPANGAIRHYGIKDGLADDFVNVAFRDSRGTLWFGTPQGVSRLQPEPEAARFPPPILISSLRIAGIEQPVSQLGEAEILSAELDHTQNNIQVEFFSLDFSLGENIRYQYKLEGAGADWSEPSTMRVVNYPRIPPGDYRFLVRAINPDSQASAIPASFSFTVLPPIWQRWWFTVLTVFLVVAVIYALYRFRLTKLLEIERTRTRIASDLHDDIGASLSRIAMLSEVVKRQNGAGTVSSSKRLTLIADNARDLVDSMSDIVWSIDPNSDSLSSVVARVRSFAGDTLGECGVKWKLDVPPELGEIYLSSEKRRGLYLILKEAVVNIARHAKCQNASIEISVNNKDLIVEVVDDGVGFPVEQNGDSRGGRGLQNMSKRAAELGGQLGRSSSEGRTKLVVIIPRKESKSMYMLFGRSRKG